MGHPLVPLNGRSVRPRPLIPVTLIGPLDSWTDEGLLDTGSDDTIFPEGIARRIGVDLTNAPSSRGAAIGMGVVPLRYAEVTLRVADNREQHEWVGWVGFTPAKLRHATLGFAGFLPYFTATFLGDREEVELAVNSLYPGT
ncbi:MAG TPA: hypothetical protein VNK04_09120 [Gemmataceae bacterium]|nr:hypothetical protein [Gemmataceae bacterium]